MPEAIPPNRRGLIPHLVCSPCTEAIEFYRQAFGAIETGRMMAPDGQRVMHAELELGDQAIYLADPFPEYCDGASRTPQELGGTPVTLHRYVEDCDAAIRQAEAAGATVRMPATDMFWGDRYGMVCDPFGHCWSLATHQRDVPPEEMQQAMEQAFTQA